MPTIEIKSRSSFFLLYSDLKVTSTRLLDNPLLAKQRG